MTILPLFLSTAACLCALASSPAQTVGGNGLDWFRAWTGPSSGGEFGSSVAGAGDVNGDGFEDVIIGEPFATVSGNYRAGSVWVYSTADGSLLHEFHGPGYKTMLGRSVAGVGDLDQDGFDDILVGMAGDTSSPYTNGAARVYSGRNGSILHEWIGPTDNCKFGYAVASAGDLDLDGVNDVLVGAPHTQVGSLVSAGSAFLLSGATGTLIQVWQGTRTAGLLGYSVASMEDLNGDLLPEILVGEPGNAWIQGRAFMYSGPTPIALHTFQANTSDDNFGMDIAPAGDVDQDGIADVIIGSPVDNNAIVTHAFVYSGSSGALLADIRSADPDDKFGFAVCGVGDIDEDGFDDVAVGAPEAGFTNTGTVSIYSVQKQQFLYTMSKPAHHGRFGHSISQVGDNYADGFAEFVVGSPTYEINGTNAVGKVTMGGNNPNLFSHTKEVSVSLGGRVQFDLKFPSWCAHNQYMILMSALGDGPTNFGVDVPLTMDKLLGDNVAGVYHVPSFHMHGVLDQIGTATGWIDIPAAHPGLQPGASFWVAAIAIRPLERPRHSSKSIRVDIVP